MSGLEVAHATVTFGQTVAVNDVSVSVPAGKVLAMLGPSGCGKSTLLRAVAGLQALAHGSVAFDGHDVTDTPTHKRGFALMFQDGQLFDHLTVAGNVAYPLRRQGVSRRDARVRVEELLELVGLSGIADRRPESLSGGQQQRVALARALAARPRLLLLDEPLSALDRALRERLAAELRDILASTSTTALFVTHDHSEALTVADDLAVMSHGSVVRSGPALDVWRHPGSASVARFLGYSTILDGTAARVFGERSGMEAAASYGLRDNAFRAREPGPDAGAGGSSVQ